LTSGKIASDIQKHPESDNKVQRSKYKDLLFVMKKRAKTFTISAVAEEFEVHPQTLRLYEREGLLKPSRSEGNTRLYTDVDLERLELILSLTRDLGVNLAGVEIILNMREKMDAMQQEFERFFEYLQTHAEELSHFTEAPPPEAGALVAINRINRSAPARRRATGKSSR
jgi:MerR family transcriptional regulator/heat shock protein HspR